MSKEKNVLIKLYWCPKCSPSPFATKGPSKANAVRYQFLNRSPSLTSSTCVPYIVYMVCLSFNTTSSQYLCPVLHQSLFHFNFVYNTLWFRSFFLRSKRAQAIIFFRILQKPTIFGCLNRLLLIYLRYIWFHIVAVYLDNIVIYGSI